MLFRLAHLSDIHLGPLPAIKRRELLSKRITGYANWRLNRKGAMHDGFLDALVAHMLAAKPDHIAVTGDLVNLALREEMRLARAWLETLGDADSVSAVPGNHDTYVPGALKDILELWRPFMSGDDAADGNPFPYLRRRGPMALIGTNSGRATMPFMATGSFRSQQAYDTARLLDKTRDEGLFRIVMIHHPPFENATAWSKRLIGSSRFRMMIAEHGAELVLHGHTHIDSVEAIDGPDGLVPIVGVPSASVAPRDQRPESDTAKRRPGARYNLFAINGAPGGWRCQMEEYGFRDGDKEVSLIAERTLQSPP
ncbi:MAG: metallophosphoesterase [Ahrensia sp.]|nr:metallophosphoesterase [Ahrensia sp.]